MFLIKLKRKVPRERKAKGGKKTEETTRGGALAGYRNLGRQSQRARHARRRVRGSVRGVPGKILIIRLFE